MKNIELIIPDMKSTHCQAKVVSAIKVIEGANIEKLEAGKLTFSVINDKIKEKLIEAIELAGYKVRDNHISGSSSNSRG